MSEQVVREIVAEAEYAAAVSLRCEGRKHELDEAEARGREEALRPYGCTYGYMAAHPKAILYPCEKHQRK